MPSVPPEKKEKKKRVNLGEFTQQTKKNKKHPHFSQKYQPLFSFLTENYISSAQREREAKAATETGRAGKISEPG